MTLFKFWFFLIFVIGLPNGGTIDLVFGGKTEELKRLLSNKMFETFKSQIVKRQKKGEKLSITFIGVNLPKLINAEMYNSSFARMKLEFITEQVQTIKSSSGKIIDGDINQILNITEIWTFTKNMKDKNPNWILEKIEEILKL